MRLNGSSLVLPVTECCREEIMEEFEIMLLSTMNIDKFTSRK